MYFLAIFFGTLRAFTEDRKLTSSDTERGAFGNWKMLSPEIVVGLSVLPHMESVSVFCSMAVEDGVGERGVWVSRA